MSTSADTLSIPARQASAVDALALGSSITRAAEVVGVSRKTIYLWLENASFKEALAARRKELADRVADRRAELAHVAITTIIEVLQSDKSVGYERQSQAELAERILTGLGLLGGGKPADCG
jgi:transposase